MRIKRISFILVAMLLVFVVGGCAPTTITGRAKVKQDSFRGEKKFAVVTIAATKKFYGEKGLMQMFKKTENIAGGDTQPIIDKLSPEIIRTLSRSEYFKLVPESKVLKSKAYKELVEDERVQKVLFFSKPINTARGYKYISDPEKLAKLAEELRVDGVITILMSFSIQSGKTFITVAGVSAGKKSYSAVASVNAIAYDRNGKVIWKDSTVKQAEPGDKKAIVLLDVTDLTNTNFEKLHPSAVDMGKKAVGVLMARFTDTMEGKKVSFIQKMK